MTAAANPTHGAAPVARQHLLLRTSEWLLPARLSVLIFHRVLRVSDPLRPMEPCAVEFESRMRWLRENFRVLPLEEAVLALGKGTLPRRALAITFDDGYADNYDVALPILQALGLPATFFIATAYLDGGRMFNDTVIEATRQVRGPRLDLNDLGLGDHPVNDFEQKCATISALLSQIKYLAPAEREAKAASIADRIGAHLPQNLMMSSSQVAGLATAGMYIGGHTARHPILAKCEPGDARREIELGRDRLQEIVGTRVATFAYPNGHPGRDYLRSHVEMVRELGFSVAVSTAWGSAGTEADALQIPRFTPWDRTDWRFGLRMTANLLKSSYARV